jgi:photosystem II stability/assembly factor-like uncharacterized protein
MKLAHYLSIIFIFIQGTAHAFPGWQQVNPGFSQTYNCVHFIDTLTGMACGNSGAIVKTTNAGISWTNLNSGTTYNLNTILMFSSSIAVAAGDNQIIIRTTDGGTSWNTLNSPLPLNYSIQDLHLIVTGQAIATSSTWVSPYYNVYLYKTTNSGANWQIQSLSASFANIWFSDFNTGWSYESYFTGPPFNQYYLRVYKSTNSGSSWTVVSEGSGVSINPGKIYFYGLNLGFKYSYIGTSVYFTRTEDGGNYWTSLPSLTTQLIRCFYFVNTQTGWMVGDNSVIKKTENGGNSWTDQVSPVTANLKSVYFVSPLFGWIAAGSSGLLKTVSGGVTSVNKQSNEIPVNNELIQNYPNPFNPSTNIKYRISNNSFVTLKIYNILGKEKAILVNEKQSPGTYEVSFDGNKLASGIYFYKLETEGFSEIKEMVLIK